MLAWETINVSLQDKQRGEQAVFVQRIVGRVMLLDDVSEPPLLGVTPHYTFICQSGCFLE